MWLLIIKNFNTNYRKKKKKLNSGCVRWACYTLDEWQSNRQTKRFQSTKVNTFSEKAEPQPLPQMCSMLMRKGGLADIWGLHHDGTTMFTAGSTQRVEAGFMLFMNGQMLHAPPFFTLTSFILFNTSAGVLNPFPTLSTLFAPVSFCRALILLLQFPNSFQAHLVTTCLYLATDF